MAAVALFIDEGVHEGLAAALRRQGIDAVNAREYGRKEVKDAEYSRIWQAKDGREVLIREAQGSDSRPVLDYLERVSAETDFLTFGPGEFGLSENEEGKYLENCRLALIEENLVGLLSFSAGSRPRVRHTGELSTSVLQSYWGLGVASALMDSLVEWARSTAVIKKINLRVRTDNHRAIALYTHKGFVVEGTVKKEMYVNGIYYDNLLMGLDIKGVAS
jgi:RimJ/RimL family protein N-acetyltransferase